MIGGSKECEIIVVCSSPSVYVFKLTIILAKYGPQATPNPNAHTHPMKIIYSRWSAIMVPKKLGNCLRRNSKAV